MCKAGIGVAKGQHTQLCVADVARRWHGVGWYSSSNYATPNSDLHQLNGTRASLAVLQDVLFESKLASMCLMPKIINEEYLRPDEVAFMLKHVPSFRRHGQKASSNSNAVVFTHTYDSVCPPCHCSPDACLRPKRLPAGMRPWQVGASIR